MVPLTIHHLPKPLFPLGGKVPIAELWVRKLVAAGITDITMNLCVLPGPIRRHFGDGSGFGAAIRYLEEETPSGTLGGVCRQVLEGAGGGGATILAPSGDIVTDFDPGSLAEMYRIHRAAGAALTMVLVPIPPDRRKDFGTVFLDRPTRPGNRISESGRITDFFEKDPDSPSVLNNASIYLVERSFLQTLDGLRTEVDPLNPTTFYDFGKHVFPAMLGRLPHVRSIEGEILWGIRYEGLWFDVGQKRDYLRVNEALLDGQLDAPLPYERVEWGYRGRNVSLDPARVRITPPVIVGDDCRIEPGCALGPYAIIGDGWTLGENVRVRRSVLWERYGYHSESGTELSGDAYRAIDRHEISPGVSIEESIITGGTIDRDLAEETALPREDGRLLVLPLHYQPEGPRA